MKHKHTPGPWAVLIDNDTIDIVSNAGTQSIPVADMMFDEVQTFAPVIDEAIANARLIASAPDLLEALIELADVSDDNLEEKIFARAVIAKATGNTP
jgi:hypothetical protein